MSKPRLIYKFTSPSGKSYIGQTNNLHARTIAHRRAVGRTVFSSAISKYGFENFTKEILKDNLALNEANYWEEKLIKEHNTLVPYGYNIAFGGDNYEKSSYLRKKIGDSQRGKKKNPRKYTPEGLQRIRDAAARGAYKGWTGKTHTQEAKDKISRPIRELTTGKEFTSLTNALDYYNLKMPTLFRALQSGKPITKGDKRGLQFIYAESVNKETANPNLRGERYQAPIIDYSNCSIEGCGKPHAAKGFCLTHYKQNRK